MKKNKFKFNIPKNSFIFTINIKCLMILEWEFLKVKKFIEFLYGKKGVILFSSEINNQLTDRFFSKNFNTMILKIRIIL